MTCRFVVISIQPLFFTIINQFFKLLTILKGKLSFSSSVIIYYRELLAGQYGICKEEGV